jgi:group I intron endonuclease
MQNKFLINNKVLVTPYPQTVRDKNRLRAKLKNRSGVYALVNKLNGKGYVGSSVDLYERILDYNQPGYQNDKSNTLIVRAILEHGIENFDVVILEFTDRNSTLQAEQVYLTRLLPEYNILTQSHNSLGYKHDATSKLIISLSIVDKPRSDEVRKAMSERQTGSGNTFYGKQHTEESKALIRNRALSRLGPHSRAEKVVLTNVKDNTSMMYKSMRDAREQMKCTRRTLTKYYESGGLFRNTYHITIFKKDL